MALFNKNQTAVLETLKESARVAKSQADRSAKFGEHSRDLARALSTKLREEREGGKDSKALRNLRRQADSAHQNADRRSTRAGRAQAQAEYLAAKAEGPDAFKAYHKALEEKREAARAETQKQFAVKRAEKLEKREKLGK